MAWNAVKNTWIRDQRVNREKKWIGITSEDKKDINIPLGHSWGYSRVIRDVENAPNEALERYIKPERRAFGRVKVIPLEIREALRMEIVRRSQKGEYIFSSFTERKRMHRISTTLIRLIPN